jgi:hypothetical protein
MLPLVDDIVCHDIAVMFSLQIDIHFRTTTADYGPAVVILFADYLRTS